MFLRRALAPTCSRNFFTEIIIRKKEQQALSKLVRPVKEQQMLACTARRN